MTEREDLQLAGGVLRREPGAFDELYRRHAPAVYAWALRRLGGAEAAEEATQETFVRALNSMSGYRGEAPLGAWLLAIARRAAAGARPEARPAAAVDLAAVPVESLGLGREETRELVELALAGLSEKERRVLVGYYGKDRSIEDVAGREALSAAAAHSLLQRARERFRAAFERIAGEGGQ
jgi:RNA polymerase sigma-70 factor (ECF subfamily)